MLCVSSMEEADESQSVQVCRALSGRLGKVEVCTCMISVVAMPSLWYVVSRYRFALY